MWRTQPPARHSAVSFGVSPDSRKTLLMPAAEENPPKNSARTLRQCTPSPQHPLVYEFSIGCVAKKSRRLRIGEQQHFPPPPCPFLPTHRAKQKKRQPIQSAAVSFCRAILLNLTNILFCLESGDHQLVTAPQTF